MPKKSSTQTKPEPRRKTKFKPSRRQRLEAEGMNAGEFVREFLDEEAKEKSARALEETEQACLEHKRLFRRIAPKNNEAAELIRRHAKKCVFYPACGLDWNPLCLLSDECDLFLYCDWCYGRRSVRVALNSIEAFGNEQYAIRIIRRRLVELHVPRLPHGAIYRPPFVTNENKPADCWRELLHKRPFAWLAELEQVVRGRRRNIKMLYLSLEDVGAYWQYFAAQEVAPKYICWRAAVGFAGNWTEFHRWDNALGRAVDANPKKPKFIISGVKPQDGYDWPWVQPVRSFDNWGTAVYARLAR